jgi:hypothetical protein
MAMWLASAVTTGGVAPVQVAAPKAPVVQVQTDPTVVTVRVEVAEIGYVKVTLTISFAGMEPLTSGTKPMLPTNPVWELTAISFSVPVLNAITAPKLVDAASRLSANAITITLANFIYLILL